jgi:hypothetical protein
VDVEKAGSFPLTVVTEQTKAEIASDLLPQHVTSVDFLIISHRLQYEEQAKRLTSFIPRGCR